MNKLYLIALLNVLALGSCGQNPEPETFLIPQSFTGRVHIIFNRKDGAPFQYENGSRIYEIPNNGILLTQFKDQNGLIDHHYYYVDSTGQRTLLKIFDDEAFKDRTSKVNREETGIFFDGTTGQYGNLPNAVWWQEFVVSSYNNINNFFSTEYKKQLEGQLRKATGVEVIIP
jgi:hypothetical protein